MRVVLKTPRGWKLEAAGNLDEELPVFTGEGRLQQNPVIEMNLWAHACAEKERRVSRSDVLREELAKRAANHATLVCGIADLVERIGSEKYEGWCSGCFQHTTHAKVDTARSVPTYICGGCGAATLRCAALRCENMATRGFGAIRIPRYCAEHRHDLPSFERGADRIGDLSEHAELFKFDKRNLAKTTKVAGGVFAAAGVMTGVGLMAAPLIGGIVGTSVGGYTGAAATSYGLALLGGGPIAAGGFGMAGGTMVVAAAGAGLGGVMGAGLTNAYVSEDKSFKVEKLKDGPGIAVVICSGFLTEGQSGWGDWERIVTEKYPDSPVYRVHWGARELKDLAFVLGASAGRAGAAQVAKAFAMKAGKKAAMKVGPIGGALVAIDLVKNPWWRARERANKTGAVVADLIARTDLDEVVLAGHSLGARAMVCAAEALGTKGDGPKIREMHLLGAAIGAPGPWDELNAAVDGTVYNYHSVNDKILKFVYALAQGGSKAAGGVGMSTKMKKIKNIDVSSKVKEHSAYCRELVFK